MHPLKYGQKFIVLKCCPARKEPANFWSKSSVELTKEKQNTRVHVA